MRKSLLPRFTSQLQHRLGSKKPSATSLSLLDRVHGAGARWSQARRSNAPGTRTHEQASLRQLTRLPKVRTLGPVSGQQGLPVPGGWHMCRYLSPHPRTRTTGPSSAFPAAGKERLPGEFLRGLPTYSSFHSTIILASPLGLAVETMANYTLK